MALHLKPEAHVPLTPAPDITDFTIRSAAAANTVALLVENGLELDVTNEDRDNATKLVMAHAADPEHTSKKVTTAKVTQLTPATLMLTDKLLKDFGHSVVTSAQQVRFYVTNRLIEESDNPDARIRIRALELLGKISDVGLFADKTEVTVTHQTTDDLKDRLRQKLTKLVSPQQEPEDAIILDGEAVDLDAEMGLK